jgi:predicted nucleic acid-binding Zn ribbon protein
MTAPQRIGEVLDGLIEDLGIERRLDEARAVDAWHEVVGPKASSLTDSVWLKGGRLFVHVNSAVWRTELHRSRTLWKDRINAHLGKPLVEEIIFR